MHARSHPFSEPLRTDNLVLRLPLLEDEADIVGLWNDPSFNWLFPQRYDGSAPDPEDVAGLARSVIRYGSALLIRDLEGVPLGTIHLSGLWRDTAEVGWYVAPEHRRRGIAREAARAVVLHLLENHNLAVQARMDGANAASRGLAGSLGFAPVPDRAKGSVGFATTLQDQRDILDREAEETMRMRPAA
ncbi:GNAT family N-acetyltransferase [Methylobacterium radiotolerans]|uniref:GNAT family N-acetyltransferase n=1 Tax=Methylobacterium radiotolerans TaxID=31998 RepID=UPI0038CF74C7